MVSFTHFARLRPTNWSKWIWIGLAAIPAIRLYYVQEMIAALIMFSVLFVAVATVALIIFLLDSAGQRLAAWAGAGVGRLLRWATDEVESIFARPAMAQAVPHRFRKGQTNN